MNLPRRPPRVVALAFLLVLSAGPASAHDPSAWGGLFRSRDHGVTWVSANRGQFVSGALALAISPVDVNHLLLGTDSALLRSRNGGRDWALEAPSVLAGAIFAVAFAADGRGALVSTGLGIFRNDNKDGWRQVRAPAGATPARVIVRGAEAGRVYLAGWTGLFRSNDGGLSWSKGADGLPDRPTTTLLVVTGPPEALYAVVDGRIWASVDGARTWTRRGPGTPTVGIEALARDSTHSARLWAAGADRLFKSEDGGANWRPVGRPLPEPNTSVRGIIAAEEAVVATTDRGLYRSVDGAEHWALVIDNVPAHLEAGPLVRDPVDPATLYTGFALIPYAELWRRAAERESALARVSLPSLAGTVAILIALALGAVAALRVLGHYYYGAPDRTPAKTSPTLPSPRDRRGETTLP